MKLSTECLEASQVDSLLQGNLTPEEYESAQNHLELCETCRDRVEAAIGPEQWWSDVQSVLLNSRTGSPSPRNASSTDAEPNEPSTAKLLDLLGPTDDPNMLGRIGSYEIIGVLGQGGMGAVFKGFDRSLNRFVAIKMLLPHLAASGAARKRFAREGQAVAAVVDDHVMAIHCVDEWQGVPYLVMTYSRGVSLQKRLSDNGPLEVREILRIGMQAAKGLAAAHAQGIVHRDIKPANIFLDQNVERVQLMDFGLARAVDDASLTRSGTLAGTPQYMSPEQARAETVDHCSDLFSLGSVMYAMCTGHAPFRAESSYSVLRLITDKEPRPIREINPDIPEWLCAIIGKLMAKQANERFASANEVAVLLEDCLAHVQQPTSAPLPASLVPHATTCRSVFNVTRTGVMTMLGIFGMTLLGMVLWQATEAPDISGQWTSDEWGTVVLEAKEPGQYEGTFGGNDKTGKPTTGNLPPEKEPLTAWGKEVGGLQAGLGLDYGSRRTYGHGEGITLVVRLRNVGKEAVKFTYLRQYLDENLAVTDADGIAVPQCNTKFMPPNDPESENLEPGKEIVLKTRMHGSNGVPFVLIPSNSKDLKLDENFRPLVVGIGKVQLQIEKVFGTYSFTLEKLSTGKLELEVNNQPGGSGFRGSSSEILPGSPRAYGVPPGSNKGQSGTLHLKWSRVERRFNGTWGKGAERTGTMSLRLVDKEIRGGWTTDEDVQLESGTPLLGDLLWKRSQNTVGDAVERSSTEKQRSQPSGFDDQSSKNATPNDLQGVWDYISVEADGVVTDYTPASSQVLTITGDLWKMNNSMGSANRVEIDGRNLTLHGTTSRGPSTGVGGYVPSICYGIYSLEGDTLALCMTAFEAGDETTTPGIGRPFIKRPQTFETKGTRNLVFRLRRAVEKGSAIEKPLERHNARTVVEAFVGAILAGDKETVDRLSTKRLNELEHLVKMIEFLMMYVPTLERLPIESVSVNDAANPSKAIALSELFKWDHRIIPKADRPTVMLRFELGMSEEGWFVTEISIDTKDLADVELKKFLEGNPNAISVPPQAVSKAEKSTTIEKSLDRQNARAVVEAFVAAAIAGDEKTINTLAPIGRSQAGVELYVGELKFLKAAKLPIESVYVHDLAKPTKAMATSVEVRLGGKTPRLLEPRDGFLVLTLVMRESGWTVTDIDFESKETAGSELKKFLEANPKEVESAVEMNRGTLDSGETTHSVTMEFLPEVGVIQLKGSSSDVNSAVNTIRNTVTPDQQRARNPKVKIESLPEVGVLRIKGEKKEVESAVEMIRGIVNVQAMNIPKPKRLQIREATVVEANADSSQQSVESKVVEFSGARLRLDPSQPAILTEDDIMTVESVTDPNNPKASQIVLTLTLEAGERFRIVTTRLSSLPNPGYLVIEFDGTVLSAPRVNNKINNEVVISFAQRDRLDMERVDAAIRESIATREKVAEKAPDAKAVVEAYIAAINAGDVEKAAALSKKNPSDQGLIAMIPDFIEVQRLTIATVYVDDPANPKRALATSKRVEFDFERKQPNGQPNGQLDGFMVFKLEMSDTGWFVTHIDFLIDGSLDRQLIEKFLDVNPKAISVPNPAAQFPQP